MERSVLIVRLGALGDIVHALPVAAELRHGWPGVRIDWLVDWRYHSLLELALDLDRLFIVGAPPRQDLQVRLRHQDRVYHGLSGYVAAIRDLRRAHYDVALDLQGLIKSAALARAAGARRTIGFGRALVREPAAVAFYTETVKPPPGGHVIRKNLAALAALGFETTTPDRYCHLEIQSARSVDAARIRLGLPADARFAVLNPGGGWPNKRWPPERFGEVARHLRDRHGLRSLVLWGPGEDELATQVAAASDGAAATAMETTLGDLLALMKVAAVVVAGDTGPLHLAASIGAPIVGIYGPTNPERNGPWDPMDISVSRFDQCACHHKRRCTHTTWCLAQISAAEVNEAVDRRLRRVAGVSSLDVPR